MRQNVNKTEINKDTSIDVVSSPQGYPQMFCVKYLKMLTNCFEEEINKINNFELQRAYWPVYRRLLPSPLRGKP